MNEWRFVEQERLKVGDPLPKGCALVPCKTFENGELLVIGAKVWRMKNVSVEMADAENAAGDSYRVFRSALYRVVEPVPTAPQKLDRLPKVGEKFWMEMECLDIDREGDVKAEIINNESDLSDVVWLTGRLFVEDSRYDELKELKVELLEIKTKIRDLEASIRKSK